MVEVVSASCGYGVSYTSYISFVRLAGDGLRNYWLHPDWLAIPQNISISEQNCTSFV